MRDPISAWIGCDNDKLVIDGDPGTGLPVRIHDGRGQVYISLARAKWLAENLPAVIAYLEAGDA